MTYGFRLNIEDIFFRLADKEYEKAKKEMGKIEDGLPIDDCYKTYIGPKSNDSIASCTIAIIGWSIGLEAFVNQVFRKILNRANITDTLKKKLFYSLNLIEKIKTIFEYSKMDYSDASWLSDIKTLVELRNRFIHFKDDFSYQGFEFVPPSILDLQKEKLDSVRSSIEVLIGLLLKCDDTFDIRDDFIKNAYKITTIDP